MPIRTPPAFARANGMDLCYDTFGDPGAPPLVLIMGLATQMIAWDDDFCAQLADRGYWVTRFDNRDVGQSTWLNHAGTKPALPDSVMLCGLKLASRSMRLLSFSWAQTLISSMLIAPEPSRSLASRSMQSRMN